VYDNDCLIFFDNISTTFKFPNIFHPPPTAMRSLIDTVTALYDGDDNRITNAIVIHLVIGEVDAGTKRNWEEQLDYTSLPLWSECESALNKRYQKLVYSPNSNLALPPQPTISQNAPSISHVLHATASVELFLPQPS